MKAKINYKSRKTIIIIAVALILLIAAIAGTVVFIKGNSDASAAMTENQEITTPTDNEDNGGVNGDESQSGGDEQDNPQEQIPTVGEENDNDQTTVDDGNQNADENADNTATNNGTANNTGTTNNGTTGTTTGTTASTVPNQEYTQTTTIITENPWETTMLGWTPITVSATTATTKLNINKATLENTKLAFINVAEDADLSTATPVYTAAQKGDVITYVIRVKNISEIDATNIRVLDSVPEGTTLVENSISNEGIITGEDISWKVKVAAGEETYVSFKVVVTADEISLIDNIAKVDGEQNEDTTTHTPIITNSKTAMVVVKNEDGTETLEDRDAKVGETIRYTITVTNTTDYDGITQVYDEIPVGTTLIPGTITGENASIENGVITWENVVAKANSDTAVSFDVIVNKEVMNEETNQMEPVTSVKNTAVVGGHDTNETETKIANITTTKTSVGSAEELHELDTITYTLTATNSGNGVGSVTISDEVPVGTTLEGVVTVTGDTTEYTEQQLNEGIIVELQPGETKSVTFTVKISVFKLGDENVTEQDGKTIRTIENSVAAQDETTIPGTEDKVEKSYVTLTVNKDWVDNEIQAKRRPDTIKFILSADGDEIDSYVMKVKDGEDTYTFPELPKYDADGTTIEYTATETEVNVEDLKFYTPSSNGPVVDENGNTIYEFTNTFTKPDDTTPVEVEKVWDDNSNAAGKRPTSVTLQVSGNGTTTNVDVDGEMTAESWTETVDLPKYDANGNEIEYTAAESATGSIFYVNTDTDSSDLKVTNKFEVPNTTTTVEAKKVWNDNNNAAGKRPTSVTLQISGNGTTTNVDVDGDITAAYWTETVNLPKYDAKGDEIVYTATENATGSIFYVKESESGLTVTNKFEVPNTTTTVEAKKVWNDNNNAAGKRPTSVTLQISGNGTTTNVDVDGDMTAAYWTETVNLPKYDAKGDEIVYTATENATGSIFYVKESESGLIVTNKFEVPNTTTTVEAKKVWNDNNNAAGKRPTSVTLQISGNGTTTNVDVDGDMTAAYWTETVNLPKYDAKGDEIVYTATENATGSIFYVKESESGLTVTNKFEVPNTTAPVTVTKVWDDNNNAMGKRPTTPLSIQFKNGNSTIVKELTGTGNTWEDSFDLPKYDANGNEITYTIEEANVPNEYIKSVNGNTITNSLPRISVTKEVYSLNNEIIDVEEGEEATASVVAGDVVGYKIIVTNIGNVKLDNIIVTDEMENENEIFLDYNNPEDTTNTIATELSLEISASQEYIVYYQVKADDVKDVSEDIKNVVIAEAEYEDSNGNKAIVEDEDNAIVNITDAPYITIAKSQSIDGGETTLDKNETDEKVEPGTTITYTIVVTNTGNTIQEDVVVTDVMTINGEARNITNVKVNGEDSSIAADGTINIGDLQIGEFATITATYEVIEEDMAATSQDIVNNVSVNKTNSDATTPEDEVKVQTEEWITNIEVTKVSTLEKQNPESVVTVAEYGDTIKYTITATNYGKKPGSVIVTDTVPEGTTLKAENNDTNLTTAELAALETADGLTKTLAVAGEDSTSIYFEVIVTDKPGENIKNTATWTGGTTSDGSHDVEKMVKVMKQSLTPGTITNSNIVIVLDISGSMDYYTTETKLVLCEGGRRHDHSEAGCQYNEVEDKWYRETYMTRLEVAQEVIKGFIGTMNFEADGTGCAVSIVTFSGAKWGNTSGTAYTDVLKIGYEKDANGNDVAVTIANTENEANSLIGVLTSDAIVANGGTCISGALIRAEEQVKLLKAANETNNNIVIFVGDGDPDGDVGNIKQEAEDLRDTGAIVYAIGFEQDVDALEDVASTPSDKYYFTTSDDLDLTDVFEQVGKDIVEPAQQVETPSVDGKIILTNIDMTKDVTIRVKASTATEFTLETKTGNEFLNRQDQQKIKYDAEGEYYYLDLQVFNASDTIEIDYIEAQQTPGGK